MTIKTIALIVFDLEEAEWLINKCFSLALSLEAHVIGLHALPQFVFYDGIGAAPAVDASFQDRETGASGKIHDLFEDLARRNDLRAEFRRQEAPYGREAFLLAGARGADLVVMASHAPDRRSADDEALAERLIRELGRPVLVLSQQAEVKVPFGSLTIGWSETREATRAAHDAITLARPGATIQLVGLQARPGDEAQAFDSREDFAAALDRQGFRATTTDRRATAPHRGEELISAAQEAGSGLLVAGAFGHSPFYDFMIGAVTSHLMRHATLPVLLSH